MKKKKQISSHIKSVVFGLALILILAGVGYLKMDRDRMVKVRTKIIPEIVKKLDPSIQLKEVANLKKVSGIYAFDLKLEAQGQEQKFTSYMTKDGALFFTGGITVSDLNKKASSGTTDTTRKPATCSDITKSDAPLLTAYIVANCPYGIQMQRVMKLALAEFGDLGKFLSVKYIGSIKDGKITSMHGDEEAQENLRQICIREEQQALYWPYVICYMKEGKSAECLTQAGVNQTQLATCTSDAQKGLAYAKKDFDSASALKVSGSPTVVINGMVASEYDFGGRNAESLKQLICCGSGSKLAFCDKTLSKEDAAISFSTTDKGQASGSTSANCNPQ